MEFVNRIEQFVQNKIDFNERGFALVDSPNIGIKPPILGHYRPDFFFCHNNTLIIGEAKTTSDYDKPHSINQYITYLDECQSFQGKSLLVICCSWTVSLSLKTLIKYIKKQHGYNTLVSIISEKGAPEILV